MQDHATQKAELRGLIRQKRRAQEPDRLRRDSALLASRLLELPELKRAKWVFCYVSCKGEVETQSLIETLLLQGKRLAVPRCKADGQMDCVEIRSLEELTPGMLKIPEPPPEALPIPSAWIDFAVVPALACGEDGTRLGQGGGYYDRFLAKNTCDFAAVCLEEFLFPTVPCEEHDRKMKLIVTQQRVLRFEEL